MPCKSRLVGASGPRAALADTAVIPITTSASSFKRLTMFKHDPILKFVVEKVQHECFKLFEHCKMTRQFILATSPSLAIPSSDFFSARHKVIPEKEHPIKNLIRKQKTESTKGTKSTNKSMSCSCLSCFSWTMLLVGSLLEIT